MLGIRGNNPALQNRGNGITREIEDMMRNRRPFASASQAQYRPTNNYNSNTSSNNEGIIDNQKESNNSRNKYKEKGKHVHKGGSRHVHSHSYSRNHRHSNHRTKIT